MGRRSRSRSPKARERRRSPVTRDRDRDRDSRRERQRSRSPRRRRRTPSPRRWSRSPVRKRSRSRERNRRGYDKQEEDDVIILDYQHGSEAVGVHGSAPNASNIPGLTNQPPIAGMQMDGKSNDELEMMKIMGFGGFDSTKGKHVNGNDVYVANIQRKRRYRQYMNRRGGFNRPLDSIA